MVAVLHSGNDAVHCLFLLLNLLANFTLCCKANLATTNMEHLPYCQVCRVCISIVCHQCSDRDLI